VIALNLSALDVSKVGPALRTSPPAFSSWPTFRTKYVFDVSDGVVAFSPVLPGGGWYFGGRFFFEPAGIEVFEIVGGCERVSVESAPTCSRP
jgi:hypothetical protein